MLAFGISAFVAVLVLAPKHRFAARPAPVTNAKETVVEPPHDETPEKDLPAEPVADPSIIVQTAGTTTESEHISVSVSALEPANLDGPLPHLPTVNSPDVSQDLPPTVLPPPPPKKDIKKNLEFEFEEYKQTKPVSRRELIVTTLHELLDAPIEFDSDELGADELDKKITFEFDKPISLGDVIKAVTEPAGWKMEIEPTGLRIRRK